MKPELFKGLAVLFGGVAMAFLFYHENLGLNTLLFTVFILTLLFIKDRSLFSHTRIQSVAGGTLLAAVMVVWHNSALAKTVHILSFIALIGLVQQRSLRFLWYGFLLGFGSLVLSPINMVIEFGDRLKGGWKNFFRWGQLIILPLFIAFFFFCIYYAAVPNFGNFSDGLASFFGRFFNWEAPGPLFWLFLLGMIISGSLLWKSLLSPFAQKRDQQFQLDMVRKKSKHWMPFPFLGLKKEYTVAIITISILNGLLLIVNISQLGALFQEQPAHAGQLSQDLHAFTELLIFSILMAMAVLLFFFRKNLNFYPNNQVLRVLSFTWLIQNGILATMTLSSDLRYIIHYGLAYHRLWLAFFLILVMIGLVTVFVKIAFKKSIFYLFVTNAMGLYLGLLIISSFNWDLLITRFNIIYAKNEEVDLNFLFHSVSAKNAFLLKKHKALIMEKKHSYYYDENDRYDTFLDQKVYKLQKKWDKQSWKSWNVVDEKNKAFFYKK